MKSEDVEYLNDLCEKLNKNNIVSKETVLIATDADCVERIQQLESEIARLKEENEELKVSNQSERTRMAWELYVSGFNHGIADKWTIEECFRTVEIFLNHAKSKEVGNG